MMPVNDNDEEFSDSDPWGSDFEEDDDDDFENIERIDDHENVRDKDDDDDDDDGSGSGSYEEYEGHKNTSAVYYSEKHTPPPRRILVSD